MRPKASYPKVFLSVIICTLFACAFLYVISPLSKANYYYEIKPINDIWTINYNYSLVHDTDITQFIPDTSESPEIIQLTGVIDDTAIIPGASIILDYDMTAIKVYADSDLIYSFGSQQNEDYLSMSSNLHIIYLPAKYSETTLRIVLTPCSGKSFSGFTPIYFGNYSDLTLKWLKDSQFVIFLGSFMFIFGLILIILSPSYFLKGTQNISVVFPAFLSVDISLYLLSSHGLLTLLNSDSSLNYTIRYISLFAIPFLASVFFYSVFKQYAHRFMFICCILNAVYLLSAGIIFSTGFISPDALMAIMHFLCLTETPSLLIIIVFNLRKNRTQPHQNMSLDDTILVWGSISLIVGGFVEVLIVVTTKLGLIMNSTGRDTTFSTIGSLIFIMCIMLHYINSSITVFRDESTQKSLEAIAYLDSLTGLANRTHCELVLDSLKNNTSNIRILCMDLDDLKKINDAHGHSEGDRLLRTFADILRECFRPAKAIGRMGGDEFIVILPEMDDKAFDNIMDNFVKSLIRHSEMDDILDFRVSIGTAKRSDTTDGKIMEIYRMADDRMYDDKRFRHGLKNTLGGEHQ